MSELNDDMIRWVEILAESREQCEQWKSVGEEARAAIINHAKATGDNTGEVDGVERYRVIDYTSKKFDRASFAKEWQKLDKEYTVESVYQKVEIVPNGRVQDEI